ncbi:MAG: hypothetical protein LBC35_06805 [Coriobacteriales bacterium]|jgi:hypothetical protein|nr:hypothetical protein [Coriobacteriales bacterium]
MTFDEFVDLSTEEQQTWLNEQLAAGKTPEDVYATLGTDKSGLGKIGVFYVPPKKAFNIKPMRGYQTTRLSGNEAESEIIKGAAMVGDKAKNEKAIKGTGLS